jgi:hypothetical protein
LWETCRYSEIGGLCPPIGGKSPGDRAEVFPEVTKSATLCEDDGGKYSPLTWDGVITYSSKTCACPLDDEPSGSNHGYCQGMIKCCDENGIHVGYKWEWETTGCADYFGVDDADAGSVCFSDPTGACCVGTSCTTGTEADCFSAGGTYLGNNSSCAGDPCGPEGGDSDSGDSDSDSGDSDSDSGDSDSDSGDSDSDSDSDSGDSDSDSGDSDSDSGDDCTNGGNELCMDPCCSPIACCKDGSCIGDSEGHWDPEYPEKRLPPLTKVTCEYVYGGIAVAGVCGDEVDCCNATIYVGACCTDEVASGCANTTAKGCSYFDGIFMGPNSDCEYINCCISGDGACCTGADVEPCIQVADEQACVDMGGEWMGGGTNCSGDGENAISCANEGACCVPGMECQIMTEQECIDADGIYHDDGSCCNVPTGACCTEVVGECTEETEADCQIEFYQGDGTTCEDDGICGSARGRNNKE